jgi:hypothetical protein
MTSEGIEQSPREKAIMETNVPKHGGEHQDVEVGAEMVNIDRIEKVYA